MKKINHNSKVKGCLSVVLLSMLCLVGCNEAEKLGLEPTDDIAPGVATNISVKNIDGGAILTYTAPIDDDLLCVMASYVVNGKVLTVKASPYVNTLKVEGFGAEGEYQVELRSVDKSRNESEPVMVTVSPTTPPVKAVFKSLKVVTSFGGVKLFWDNPTEANIIIEALKKDGDNWISIENFYSSAAKGKGSIRKLKPEPVTLKFRIRDRWDNYSEFLEETHTPLEEYEMDKKKFKELSTTVRGDALGFIQWNLGVSSIWNEKYDQGDAYCAAELATGRAITFDMGVKAQISRFVMYERLNGDEWIYSHANLKHYIVYGCNEITTEMYNSGTQDPESKLWYPDFTGWTEILDTWCYKPSGDSGKVTNEDKEYIANGDEHEIPIETPPFRYVRILMLETWEGGTSAQIGEMTFYGKVIK